MKNTKLLILALLTVSIRQVCGEKEADKKCDEDEYKCGDLCVYYRYSCSCGNITLTTYSTSYCCTAPEDTCTGGGYRDATCSRGTPVPRSETCNDKCPEDSPSNTTNAEGKISPILESIMLLSYLDKNWHVQNIVQPTTATAAALLTPHMAVRAASWRVTAAWYVTVARRRHRQWRSTSPIRRTAYSCARNFTQEQEINGHNNIAERE